MKYLSKKQIKIPKRRKESKKGDNGEVLIIGGSEDYIGCLVLAGLAALRAGVDWITIAAPEKVAWAINCLTPDLITKKIKGSFFSKKHALEIINLANKFDAVLIGNGIGQKKETKTFLKIITKKIKKFKVIDADGIKAVSLNEIDNSIIIPHLKEFETFLLNSGINKKVIKNIIKEKNISKKTFLIKEIFEHHKLRNNILILKGSIDIIISSNKIFYNKTGNPGMTKGGTGDVLAGLAVGFLAQSKDLLQSAINATYINGLIGDILLKRKKGYSFIASDMVEEIKKFLKG